MQRVKIGEVVVNGGLLMVVDPAHVKYLDEATLDRARETAAANPTGGTLAFPSGEEGLAVVFKSGVGDGAYPVHATLVENPDWPDDVGRVEIETLTPEQIAASSGAAPVTLDVPQDILWRVARSLPGMPLPEALLRLTTQGLDAERRPRGEGAAPTLFAIVPFMNADPERCDVYITTAHDPLEVLAKFSEQPLSAAGAEREEQLEAIAQHCQDWRADLLLVMRDNGKFDEIEIGEVLAKARVRS